MKLVSSREVYRSSIFAVTEEVARGSGGFEIERAIVQHGGTAVMLAVNKEGHVLLVRQYRMPARKHLWELPAGRLDPGETALQAARRELKEETGYRARKWRKLISFYSSPGFLSEKMSVFVATGLQEGEATPMGDERIERRWFTEAQLDQMIRGGKIADGKTIAGFLAWQRGQ